MERDARDFVSAGQGAETNAIVEPSPWLLRSRRRVHNHRFGWRRPPSRALAEENSGVKPSSLAQIDAILRTATDTKEVPGVVAMAATGGAFRTKACLARGDVAGKGPAMTRDTVFSHRLDDKAVTSVAATQLVEQGKLQTQQPVPDIDPALSSPQVLEGFDRSGAPQLRPAKRPITLRHLLARFTYRFGTPIRSAT